MIATHAPRTEVDGLEEADLDREVPILARLFQIFWRRRLLIGAVIAAAIIISIALTLIATRQYTATTTIEISRQNDKIVQVDGLQPEVSSIDQEFYQTQYSLLESDALADRVIADLKLENDAVFLNAFNIEPEGSSIFSDVDPARLSNEEREALIRRIQEALHENISISPVRGSRIVNVSFTSPDAALSAKVANAWVASFVTSNFDRKLQSTTIATTYLQGQLQQLRERLEKSERDLVEYANKNRIITIGESGGSAETDSGSSSITDANLLALNSAYAKAKAARINANSLLRQNASAQNIINPTLSELRNERVKLAADYANLLVTFEPEYPQARALRSQIEQIDSGIAREESRIRENLRRGYEAAVTEERQLEQEVASLETENLDQRGRGIQYNIFKREVDTNRELYDGLLQRFKEIGLAAGIGPNNIAVVDSARPPEAPSSPSLFRNLLFGLVAGLLGSGIAIFVVEQFNQKVRTPDDVARFTKYPVLGVIPDSSDEELGSWQDVKSGLSEAYMSVLTALRLSTDHGVPKSLMFTSTGPGEGKSVSCLALGRALSASGKTVIVIDSDLRLPSIHKKAGIENDVGLTEYLSGQKGWRELAVETGLTGLMIMPAGPVPPNPAELLTGDRMPKLLAELGEHFDHVLVDSPPVMGLADAPLLSERVEGCMFVLQANHVNGPEVRNAITRLSRNAQKIVGVLLTKYTPDGSLLSYSNRYTYDYGYGKNAESKQPV